MEIKESRREVIYNIELTEYELQVLAAAAGRLLPMEAVDSLDDRKVENSLTSVSNILSEFYEVSCIHLGW